MFLGESFGQIEFVRLVVRFRNAFTGYSFSPWHTAHLHCLRTRIIGERLSSSPPGVSRRRFMCTSWYQRSQDLAWKRLTIYLPVLGSMLIRSRKALPRTQASATRRSRPTLSGKYILQSLTGIETSVVLNVLRSTLSLNWKNVGESTITSFLPMMYLWSYS